jgi:predicted porin
MKTKRELTKKAMLLAAPAVFACLAGGASAADLRDLPMQVNVYGFLNAQVEAVKAEGGATPYQARGRLSDGNSRIGFNGSIGILDQTKAIWQIEASLNNFENGGTNDQGSSATLTSRNSFVGVDDVRFGRFIAGNNDSAYRSLVGSGGELGGNLGLTSHGLDLWNNTTAQMTGNWNSIFGRGEARYKNSVHYFSPKLYGFEGAVSYGFDEKRDGGSNHDRYSAALKYGYGPFEIGVGYDRQGNTGADIDKLQAGYGFQLGDETGVSTSFYKVIASYKFPTKTYFGIGWERGSYGYEQFVQPSSSSFYPYVATGQMKQNGYMVSVAQDIGEKIALMASFGKLGDMENQVFGEGKDYSATQVSLGGTYAFNKYFMTYVYYTNIKNQALQSVNFGQSPVYSNNSGTNAAYLAPGDSPRASGLGMIARF